MKDPVILVLLLTKPVPMILTIEFRENHKLKHPWTLDDSQTTPK